MIENSRRISNKRNRKYQYDPVPRQCYYYSTHSINLFSRQIAEEVEQSFSTEWDRLSSHQLALPSDFSTTFMIFSVMASHGLIDSSMEWDDRFELHTNAHFCRTPCSARRDVSDENYRKVVEYLTSWFVSPPTVFNVQGPGVDDMYRFYPAESSKIEHSPRLYNLFGEWFNVMFPTASPFEKSLK